MNESELYKMVGMLSKIAYELHDKEFVDQGLSEMLLDFWRQFNSYERSE